MGSSSRRIRREVDYKGKEINKYGKNDYVLSWIPPGDGICYGCRIFFSQMQLLLVVRYILWYGDCARYRFVQCKRRVHMKIVEKHSGLSS